MPKKKATHGGKREGAGRQPGETPPKPRISCRVSQEVADYLGTLGKKWAAAVERAIVNTEEFKTWQKDNKK